MPSASLLPEVVPGLGAPELWCQEGLRGLHVVCSRRPLRFVKQKRALMQRAYVIFC